MSDGKDDKGPPPGDDQRTVFIPPTRSTPPTGGGGQGAGPADEPADPWGGGGDDPAAAPGWEEREEADDNPWSSGAGEDEPQDSDDPADEDEEATRFEPQPGGSTDAGSGGDWGPGDDAPAAPAATSEPPRIPTTPPVAVRDNALGIQVGDILNHIFEVTRFIARGGMGEVFEGCNVNSDEKVAIKVMLPSLAADANIISMFRREARTLTRLQHEALVQYRVLAQEPQLGVLYIVTEFIDGVPLSDVLGKLQPTPEEMAALLRRLASGLRAAHALGVLHRDMSPDNVLLEGGRLGGAKIIDFGIAKDLDPGSATIVGDGFAGKLNYVAPEQLGDFGREVGPWSDVYSLALVMLAISMGRDVQMGGTLVDAVDKRRAGPDLSPVPESLRPVLEMMLRPNPAERLRSMDEVLRALDAQAAGAGGGRDDDAPRGGIAGIPKPALIGGGAVLALLVAGGIWMATSGDDQPAGGGGAGGAGPGIGVPSDPVQAARGAIDSAIPSINCSWLDIVELRQDGDRLSLKMGGVAGSPSAAQNEIDGALGAASVKNADIDSTQVATIRPGGCAAINAYRQMRNAEAPRLATKQRLWEMRNQEAGRPYAGKEAANVVVSFTIGDPKLDMTLFGIDPAGVLWPLLERVGGRQLAFAEGQPPIEGWIMEGSPISEQGNDAYNFSFDMDTEGWQGLVLITGKGPFPAEVVRPDLGARNTAWAQKFATTAQRQGWSTDMIWFKAANQIAGD